MDRRVFIMPKSSNSIEYTWNEKFIATWKYTDNIFMNDLRSPSFKIAVKYERLEYLSVHVLKYSKRPANGTIIIHYLNVTRMFSVKNWEHIWRISINSPGDNVESLKFELKWHDDIAINSVNPDFYSHTNNLLMNRRFSDVTIIIDKKRISAHKFVLAYHSPVFSAMLSGNMKENQTRRIEIKNVDLDVMKQVLTFMYTGELPIIIEEDCDAICPLLVVADMYELKALMKLCEDQLYKFLTLRNILKVFKLSSLYHLTNLRKDSINFMIHRLYCIAEMDEFKELSLEHPEIFKDVVLAINKDNSPPDVVKD